MLSSSMFMFSRCYLCLFLCLKNIFNFFKLMFYIYIYIYLYYFNVKNNFFKIKNIFFNKNYFKK